MNAPRDLARQSDGRTVRRCDGGTIETAKGSVMTLEEKTALDDYT